MRKTYRISLKQHSNSMTPFHADTVFGHLCWVVAHHEGDKSLKEFLEPFHEGSPPFVISDGFPGNLLPKPLSADFNLPEGLNHSEWKHFKKTSLIAQEDFERIVAGERFLPEYQETPIRSTIVSHNTINRLTNTTPPEGGVFSLEETHIDSISFYIMVVSDEWRDRLQTLFQKLARTGYGKKKSVGKGQFTVGEIKEFTFSPIRDPNGFVSLSNFCPAKNDTTEGLYKTFVKYGKLGEEFVFSGNPFKRPLVMIKAGSVFRTEGPPVDYYGRLVRHIAPGREEAVQYAYAFAVPCKIGGIDA